MKNDKLPTATDVLNSEDYEKQIAELDKVPAASLTISVVDQPQLPATKKEKKSVLTVVKAAPIAETTQEQPQAVIVQPKETAPDNKHAELFIRQYNESPHRGILLTEEGKPICGIRIKKSGDQFVNSIRKAITEELQAKKINTFAIVAGDKDTYSSEVRLVYTDSSDCQVTTTLTIIHASFY